jgi:hypothetical protein
MISRIIHIAATFAPPIAFLLYAIIKWRVGTLRASRFLLYFGYLFAWTVTLFVVRIARERSELDYLAITTIACIAGLSAFALYTYVMAKLGL